MGEDIAYDRSSLIRRPKRKHTAAFNAKVAAAALKGDKTLAELAQNFDVHAKHDYAVEDAAANDQCSRDELIRKKLLFYFFIYYAT